MSGEFGNYHSNGYFHDRITTCLEDLKNESRIEAHKGLIPLFEVLAKIAHGVSWAEASDSSAADSIILMSTELENLKDAISHLENVLQPYHDVAVQAIRNHIEGKK